MVRSGDDGYRIPTPGRGRLGAASAAASTRSRATRTASTPRSLTAFWQPQPSHTLLERQDVQGRPRPIDGRPVVDGDITFQVQLADDAVEFHVPGDGAARRAARRSASTVFWAGAAQRRDRPRDRRGHPLQGDPLPQGARRTNGDETALIAEEKLRHRRHQDELRRLLREALLNGNVYFRGNDRSPATGADGRRQERGRGPRPGAARGLRSLQEAAAKQVDVKKGLDALLTAENLQGLPPVFGTLGLVRDENGKVVFKLDERPAPRGARRASSSAPSYGETATAATSRTSSPRSPSAGTSRSSACSSCRSCAPAQVEATSKGQTFDTATGPEAKDTFSNNNVFRPQPSGPRRRHRRSRSVVAANLACKDTFGTEAPELSSSSLAAHLRAEVGHNEDRVAGALATLNTDRPARGGCPGDCHRTDAGHQPRV